MLSKNPFRSRLATQATGASSSSSGSASVPDIFADPVTVVGGSNGTTDGPASRQSGEHGVTSPTSPSSGSTPSRIAGALNSSTSSSAPAPSPSRTNNTESGRYAPPPGPPPPSRRSETRTETAALDDSMGALSLDPPPAPPAYAPAPNVWAGESSMEFGPRRAFLAAPPPLIVQTQGMLSGPPPPEPQQPPTGPRRTGDNPYPDIPLGVRPTPQGPPPPPPPPRHYATPGVVTSPYPQPPRPPPAPAHIQDDGKPTTVAVVGHPLMHEGRVLIYPAGYECRTCWNTGYKSRSLRSQVDLKDPCKRCWRKYSRPYEGALTYATWKPAAATFQRPIWSEANGGSSLVRRRSNSTGQLPSSSSAPPTSADSRTSMSAFARDFYNSGTGQVPATAPTSPYPAATSRTTTYNMGPNTQLNITQGQAPRSTQTPTTLPVNNIVGLPVPGFPFGRSLYTPAPLARGTSVVVRPGDARIGGRVCWKCGGDGEVSKFIFDTETCRVCNGVGRVFV